MLRHIIESQQFNRQSLGEIFALADTLEHTRDHSLAGKILASLFYEPSTRTRFSFESAMLRLGGSVITTENAKEFSSVSKGETLEDSIRIVNTYVDVIVLRHDEAGASQRASLVSQVPIINAGDGTGQHPTQALLDLYTIQRELGRLDGIRIAFVGDLKHGRTIRSLSYLLGNYENITIDFVSPAALKVGDDIKQYLTEHQVTFKESEDLDVLKSTLDVLYQTRIQKERFKDMAEYHKFKGCYQITREFADRMKPQSIIMHPLPRVDEILPEVDSSPRAVYFKQAHYGLLIRMALLKHLLGSAPAGQGGGSVSSLAS
jgi:aspartate carbamoyltransferase catalytic subunit